MGRTETQNQYSFYRLRVEQVKPDSIDLIDISIYHPILCDKHVDGKGAKAPDQLSNNPCSSNTQ